MRRHVTLITLVGLTALFVVGLALASGGAVPQTQAIYAAPAAQGNPIRVECGACPEPLEGGWYVVDEYLAWSGCQDWECWSRWINNDPSNALLEYTADRLPRGHGVANPVPWPPLGQGTIWDSRQTCADGELAKGIWYHNAYAKPTFYTKKVGDGEVIVLCRWQVDYSRQYWNFGEDDRCPYCLEPTPPATPVCGEDPIIDPPRTPIPPTPFAAVPPVVTAKAYVHSHLDPADNAYPTAPKFYWNWQEFLDASLTAEVTEPTVPGCGASSEVVAYWFYGSVGQTVCPENSSDPDCRWRPAYKGGAHPDVARPEWIHLVWSRTATPSERPATWGFFPVGPVTVDIAYSALVATTYVCDGGANTYTAFWTQDLSLQVGLLRTVRTTR